MPKFSIIIPVFNRPQELTELLQSLAEQTFADFEVVVVEDGSTLASDSVVANFVQKIAVKYIVKPNSGPALSRNMGAREASADWFLFLDSDCVAPAEYFAQIDKYLTANDVDVFGGADRASVDFTKIQKAINYSMTSFFTTGGIRGGVKSMEKFHPRSFNMGVSRRAFEALGGFADMRFGEDVDLSIRLLAAGYRSALIDDGWVYHKRRVDFSKFFRQVRASGGARITLSRKHPRTLRLVHLLPAAFTVFVGISVVGAFFCEWALLPLAIYAVAVAVDAVRRNDNDVQVGGLAVAAAFTQLIGYGVGFLSAAATRSKKEVSNEEFYK